MSVERVGLRRAVVWGALSLLATAPGCKTVTKTIIYPEDSGIDPNADYDGDGVSIADGDCDDGDPAIAPGLDEVCDGKDNDCDGAFDEDAVDAREYFPDTDYDGYGDESASVVACERSPGFTADAGDCDDTDELVNPGEEEVCNDGRDNDCDPETVCLASGQAVLGSADIVLVGDGGGAQHGVSATLVGDMDGDGLSEVAVGGWRADARGVDSGTIRIATGAWLQTGPVSGVGQLSDAPIELQGTATGHNAGEAMAPVGDIDGDGFADLLVGAFHAKGGGQDSGEAYLVLGPASGTSVLGDADLRIIGELAYDVAGGALAGGPDVTGDGVGDVLVGAVGYGDGGFQSRGAVYVVDGSARGSFSLRGATAVVEGVERYDRAGTSVAAGDINGDGVGDVVVGAETYPSGDGFGGAFVVLGPLSGRSDGADADSVLVGEAELHLAGTSVGVGDLDGDGLADIAVGAPGWSSGGSSPEGAVYVVSGAPAAGVVELSGAVARIQGDDLGDALGTALSTEADMTGDGLIDLWVGAPGNDQNAPNSGAAGVFYGPVSGSLRFIDGDFRVFGETTEDGAGAALSSFGDLNGDGVADILVTAPLNDRGTSEAGAAYLFYGTGL